MMSDAMPLWLLVAAASLTAALLANLSARLIIHSGTRLMDVPGPRSSHVRPTPRGGGIGIVIVGVLVVAALAWVDVWPLSWWASLSAFALVAVVGALDDIRHQPVALRLMAHLGAASLLVAASGVMAAPHVMAWLVVIAMVLGLAWSINLHNFMDGIDGLLASQAVWCGVVFAVLFFLAGLPVPALFALLLAAAALGFLPMNFPRARVFLGDNASGYIGLALGWLALYGTIRHAFGWPEVIVIGSAFLVDSGATLFARALRSERLWQAHRSHLYQVLVRGGYSHARVTASYMLWNLLLCAPIVLVLRNTDAEAIRWSLALAVVAIALAVWFVLRRDGHEVPVKVAEQR